MKAHWNVQAQPTVWEEKIYRSQIYSQEDSGTHFKEDWVGSGDVQPGNIHVVKPLVP